MTIRFQCAECNSVMKIKDEKAGTTGHCPKCKKEFIVPQPNHDEPVGVATKDAESHAGSPEESPEKHPNESPEDEYQRILMGDDGPGSSGSHRKPADSDTFLTGDSAGEHPRPSRSASKPAPAAAPEPPKPRPLTTAEMADALINNTAEPTVKKTGKAFGEGKGDKGDVRAKAAAAARMYYLKQYGLGTAGVGVVCFILYYMMSSMMGSQKLPPLGRVSGTVTMDGKPLAAASVSFQPIQEGQKPNTHIGGSIGITDKSGHFELLYVEGVKGAAVGKHMVQIRAQNEFGVEIVPDKYNMQSNLITEVKPGSNPPAEFPLSMN